PALSLYLLAFLPFTLPAPTAIYSLSLHDALPIFPALAHAHDARFPRGRRGPVLVLVQDRARDRLPRGRPRLDVPEPRDPQAQPPDRKSTRLNSSHVKISYAVFCLKKKKT